MPKTPIVYGYHGTSLENASAILEEGGFHPSANAGDWLGYGIYFWQDAPARALEWATHHNLDQPVVIGAEIHLETWIDLLDTQWSGYINTVYSRIAASHLRRGMKLPINTPKGNHYLDQTILDFAAQESEDIGSIIQGIRGAFHQGARLYPGSKLHRLSHVQLAVRDPNCIKGLWLE
jgi:hypothetical protein